MNNNESIKNELLDQIENNGLVMLCVTQEGEVILLTTGNISKVQTKVAEKILTVADDHSFILGLILYLEILFARLQFRLASMFKG